MNGLAELDPFYTNDTQTFPRTCRSHGRLPVDADSPMPPILEVRSLVKRFSPHGPAVVDDLTFRVEEGEILALLGPSGCGKTTILRLIAGLTRPDSGQIHLKGDIIAGPGTHVPPERRGVGLVFQDYALFPHLTVEENISFGLQSVPSSERAEIRRRVTHLMGLSGYEKRRPHQLSGGQQQRVALARTLATSPDVILLDEPFSNLDALLRQTTRQEIRAVLKKTGMTAILVTHDQEEALSIADRVAVIWNGQIEQVGTPEQVYFQPRTLFVAQFLGRTNLMLSFARGAVADTPIGEVVLNRAAEGNVLLSLRPEHLALEPDSDGTTVAVVLEREFKGHDITYKVDVTGSEYLVHMPSPARFKPGDHVALRATEPAVVLEKRSR